MKIGMIGLGKMGANMTLRLLGKGHEVVAFARTAASVDAVRAEGAHGASSIEELVDALESPRVVWVMVPAGDATESTIVHLEGLLQAGDTIVDGGNSNYRLAVRDAARLAARQISFIDAGVSGGIWGLDNGYCLMVGGETAAVRRLEPIFTDLAPPGGYAHVGPVGAGHFVKMIHNGIEYGMLQAYGEGFAIMHAADEFGLDLHQIAEVWRYGSVVRSWLLDLAELALADTDEFAKVRGWVEDSGEGRWSVEEAVNRGVAAPVLATSLFERFSSRQTDAFSARMVAALRNQFGGHRVFESPDAGPG